MRRIGAHRRLIEGPEARQARIGAALGAVAVHDIGLEIRQAARNTHERGNVGGVGQTVHRGPHHAEREMWREVAEDLVGARAARAGIDDEPDAMAAFDLLAREIDHMPKQAAERRPQDMDDLEARRCGNGHENLASLPALQASERQKFKRTVHESESCRQAGRDRSCRRRL